MFFDKERAVTNKNNSEILSKTIESNQPIQDRMQTLARIVLKQELKKFFTTMILAGLFGVGTVISGVLTFIHRGSDRNKAIFEGLYDMYLNQECDFIMDQYVQSTCGIRHPLNSNCTQIFATQYPTHACGPCIALFNQLFQICQAMGNQTSSETNQNKDIWRYILVIGLALLTICFTVLTLYNFKGPNLQLMRIGTLRQNKNANEVIESIEHEFSIKFQDEEPIKHLLRHLALNEEQPLIYRL